MTLEEVKEGSAGRQHAAAIRSRTTALAGAIEASCLADQGKTNGTGARRPKPGGVEAGQLSRSKVGRPIVVVVRAFVSAKAGSDAVAITLRFQGESDRARRAHGACRRNADEREKDDADNGESAVHGGLLECFGQGSPLHPGQGLQNP